MAISAGISVWLAHIIWQETVGIQSVVLQDVGVVHQEGETEVKSNGNAVKCVALSDWKLLTPSLAYILMVEKKRHWLRIENPTVNFE